MIYYMHNNARENPANANEMYAHKMCMLDIHIHTAVVIRSQYNDKLFL